MSARRAWEHQQKLLTQLKQKSYEELTALPVRDRIVTTSDLHGWKIFICRQLGQQGGVQITVEARKRSLLIFESVYSPGFEILPDGTILEEPVIVDD